MKKNLILPLLTPILILTACSSYRPVLDENSHLRDVGPARAQADIDLCLAKADNYLESAKHRRRMKATERGAAVGAIWGGVSGLLGGNMRDALGGAAIGSVIGGATGAIGDSAKGNLSPDELKQNYVTNCLRRMNYDVIGWD